MSLIVTGSVGIDSVETPTAKAMEVLGGSAIYFASAASFFTSVRLVAVVGEDCPQGFFDTFRKFDIDLEGLEQRKGSKTFRWHGKYHENMNDRDTIEVQPNVLEESQPPVPETWRNTEYVFLANTHPAGQLELREQFPDAKLVVADTMNLWIKTEHDLLMRVLGCIHGLVLNDSESEMLTGDRNVVIAGRKILEMGPRFVVIKKGEHGCVLVDKDHAISLPAFPAAEVNDPTGAGDSFAGGMMGHLAATGDLSIEAMRKAMAYGTVVASYNIEAFSLERMLTLDRAQIDARFGEFCSMLRIV